MITRQFLAAVVAVVGMVVGSVTVASSAGASAPLTAVSPSGSGAGACLGGSCPWHGPSTMVGFSSADRMGPNDLVRRAGRLTVRVLGAPTVGAGDVTLTGPGVRVRLSRRVTTLSAARPGRWEAVAGRVRVGEDTFFPVTQTVGVKLSAGAAGVVTVDYADEVPNHLLVVSPALLLGPAATVSSGCPIKGAKAYIFAKGDLLKYSKMAHDIAIGTGPKSPNGFLWSTNFAECPMLKLSGGRIEVWETGDAPLSVLPSGVLPATRLHGTIAAVHQVPARKDHACGKGSVSLKASLRFRPTWSMAVDWSVTHRTFTAKAALGGVASTTLDATASADTSCAPWTTDLLGQARDLGRFEVQIGPVPVVVVPKLTLPATVTARVRAAASIQVAESLDATARGSWNGTKLVTRWNPAQPTRSIKSKTLGTATTLSATVGPQIEFALYGILGPSVDIQGAAELHTSPAGYSVCTGVQAGVTLDFHLFKPFSTRVSVGNPGDLATHYWKLAGDQPCPGKWIASSPPVPGGNQGFLDDVACAGIRTCVAVGSYGHVAGTGEPLVDTQSGGAWAATTPPVPAGGRGGFLNDVSCTSARTCVAVGSYGTATGRGAPLSDTYSDRVWTATTPPVPAGGHHSELYAVSCTATGTCVAVGDYDNSSGDEKWLVDTYTDGRWTAASPPLPAGGRYGDLNDVFCTAAGACVAVGGYENSSEVGVPLVDTYSDGTWAAASPPMPAGSNDGYLSDVSCTSAGTCVAVGSYDNTNPVGDPMVETYADGAWTLTIPPLPAGADLADLQNVSCSAAGTCVAVGSYDSASYNLEPLGYTYSDGAWTSATPPEPSGGNGSFLNDVACSAADTCVAVGAFGNTLPGEEPLLDTYSDGAWTATAAPEPAGGREGFLSDVSCTATGTCVALGSSNNETLADTYSPGP